MDVVDIGEAFASFDEHRRPRIVGPRFSPGDDGFAVVASSD